MKPRLLAPVRLPVQTLVEARLHLLLYRLNRPVKPPEAYSVLADAFELTLEQLRARYLNSSGELAWPCLVRQAVRRLRDTGVIDRRPPRGLWVLTTKGRDEARLIESIDL